MARRPAVCRALAAALFFTASGPVTAIAASVSNQGGDVLVSRGQGFVPVKALTELAPGGQVLVRPSGLATISYASNCTVRIGTGIWQVQDKAPCADGATEIDFTTRMNQQAGPPPGGLDAAVAARRYSGRPDMCVLVVPAG